MSKAGSRTKKSLGQHWLADARYLKRIAEAVGVEAEDTVVEIGPGTGHLTKYLVKLTSHLIAVEMDDELAARLNKEYSREAGVLVIHEDALEVAISEVLRRGAGSVPYVVVGNLPYNVGTAIIRHFLQGQPQPRTIVAMLQAEVAERIAAKPGEMGYLSVEMQVYAEARLLFRVPPRAFRPPPKVHSGVVRLDVRPEPLVPPEDVPAFLKLAQAGFFAPRKRLRNSLAIGLGVEAAVADGILAAAGVDGEQRPAMLDIGAWLAVFRAYQSFAQS